MLELKYDTMVSNFFDLCCDLTPNEEGWKKSAWFSKANQERLFHAVSLIGNLKEGTVLDVGCGTGDFYDFVGECNYTGIDVSHNMIQAAKKIHPGLNIQHKRLANVEEKYDWVIAVGPFNLRIDEDDNVQMDYLRDTIQFMYSIANKGLSFTALSGRAVNSEDRYEQLFYYDPVDIARICFDISKHVALDHMAEPTQMVVYMPKIEQATTK